jgi:menaquinone-dependent protoporphyrinogen oxidase
MRILVTVASRHGSTREIGAEIAGRLRDAGHDVQEAEPDDVESVHRYDAVVLGSAVYVGRLAASLRDLVARRTGELAARPTWLFWSGPIGTPAPHVTAPDDVQAVAQRLALRGVRCFPGRVDLAGLGVAERALVAALDSEPGDFRDFEEVDQWAAEIAQELSRPRRRRD